MLANDPITQARIDLTAALRAAAPILEKLSQS